MQTRFSLAAKPGNTSRECTRKIRPSCHTQNHVSWSGLIPRVYPDQTKTFPKKQYISINSREHSGNISKSSEMSVSQYLRHLAKKFKKVYFLVFEGLRDRRVPRTIEIHYFNIICKQLIKDWSHLLCISQKLASHPSVQQICDEKYHHPSISQCRWFIPPESANSSIMIKLYEYKSERQESRAKSTQIKNI
jgi:hypothetical protein